MSRRVEFKRRFKFSREIPRSLNFAPPVRSFPFSLRSEETPVVFETASNLTRLLKKKKKGKRKIDSGVFRSFFSLFNRYFVSIYMYMYVYEKGILFFTGNFPIFACISIFERGGARTRVHALFVRSMRSITTRTKGYRFNSRCSELKIMRRRYINMFPFFLLVLFCFVFAVTNMSLYIVEGINRRIIMQQGRFKDLVIDLRVIGDSKKYLPFTIGILISNHENYEFL